MTQTILSQPMGSIGPRVPARENPDEFVAASLSDSKLLRALSAGWTTQEDLTYLLPILAWSHQAMVCRADADASADDADTAQAAESAQQMTESCGKQAQEYFEVLASLSLQALRDDAVPSFAKYFRVQCNTLQRSLEQHAATAYDAVCALVSGHILASVQLAYKKAGLPAIERESTDYLKADLSDLAGAPAVCGDVLKVCHEFLDDLYRALRFERVSGKLDRIQSRISLESRSGEPIALYPGVGEIMFRENDEKRNIEFSVERYPCVSEVLDPRVVRIPPGKANNFHKHAHETLFYFISGSGEILVGETWVRVKPGDAVFSPRWSVHQTRNTGTEELTLLAITDYYLTGQSYIGKYDKI